MRFVSAVALIATLAAAVPAEAASLALYPVQTPGVAERFRLGVPTVSAAAPLGAVQVTPVAFDHGYVSLGVGVYNAGNTAANFGIENIAVSVNGQPVKVFSREDLDHKAKTRAAWATVGTIVATGVVAGLAAGISSGYSAHAAGPGFVYRAHYNDHTAGLLVSTAAIGGGVRGLTSVQDRLDYTLDHLATDIVQTTTVDPGAAYGGRIVLDEAAGLKAPYDVTLVVTWKGHAYPFTFRLTHEGENVPAPFEGEPAPLLAAAAPSPVAAPTPAAGFRFDQPAPAPVAMPAVWTAPAAAPVAQPVVMASVAAPAPVELASATPTSVDPYAAGRAAARAALAASGEER